MQEKGVWYLTKYVACIYCGFRKCGCWWGETQSKVQGLLKNFCCLRNLALTYNYLDTLEKIAPALKMFEEEKLLPSKINSTIQATLNNLSKFSDNDYDDLDSHIQRFVSPHDKNGEFFLESIWFFWWQKQKLWKQKLLRFLSMILTCQVCQLWSECILINELVQPWILVA